MESSNMFLIFLFTSCFFNIGSLNTTRGETVTTDESYDQDYDQYYDQELTTEESFDDEYETPNASNETYEFNEWEESTDEGRRNSPYFGCLHSCCNSSGWLCKCDELCSYYGDCCYDSRHKESFERKENLECETLPTAFHNKRYFTVATCPINWTESSDIKERCVADESYERDPLFTVPVSNLETGLIYKNRFCAVCNGDEERVMEWSITARCDIPPIRRTHNESTVGSVSKEYIIENLEYNETRKSLGFWMDGNGESIFVYCGIKFIIPEVVEEKLRGCFQMKSECNESFRNSDLERLCEAHLDPVVVRDRGLYRNVYCALCNGEGQNDFDCNYYEVSVSGPYHFNAVVNLNYQSVENDANDRCGAKEKYDPLFKKCRKLQGTK